MNAPELPLPAKIVSVQDETPEIKTFAVKFLDKKVQEKFSFSPGKFMMLSVFGYGEMPISISSSPYKTGSISFTVANVGNASRALHSLKKGSEVGLRGPYGNGFPLQKFRNKNLAFIAGGCGFAPLRSSVYAFQAKKEQFKDAYIFFGCKSPKEMLFASDLKQWGKEKKMHTFVTVDSPTKDWKGHTGVVTKLFAKSGLPVEDTVCLLCGPPIMIHFALLELKKLGFKDEQFYASLERLMHCGLGFCAHCNIGDKYVCRDGPVFNGTELSKMPLEEK
ncbi:MAG: FAD/NAD(P)-binding protein [Candidatus Diapherotrites archaeon]|uniref:FAD/NAD(P)-binding protein n=1 Tax=Candidatus Iainarchaeum sp. TaxID=3101447 RepID=A0A939C922_9ARCH|nr:FAD/NAD(P)-binding protein [Candidatus Diapherotrites archaeon]